MVFVSIGNEKDIAGTRASWLKKEKSPNATCVRTQSGAGDSLLLVFTQIDILYSSDSVRLCSTRKLQQKYSHLPTKNPNSKAGSALDWDFLVL